MNIRKITLIIILALLLASCDSNPTQSQDNYCYPPSPDINFQDTKGNLYLLKPTDCPGTSYTLSIVLAKNVKKVHFVKIVGRD